MLKKTGCLLMAFFTAVLLSGCSSIIGMDTQAMISPPKANADQQAIHKLLQGNHSEAVTLVYPKSGDHRSAITMHDFTGDGVEDAIGFILLETGLEVQFLSKNDNGWALLARFQNTATQVDRISFADLDGDGTDNVLIGWGNTSAQAVPATLCVYSFTDERLQEIPVEQRYDSMVMTDFNSDDVNEIFLVQRATTSQDGSAEVIPAVASLLSLKNGSVDLLSQLHMDNSIVRFSNMSFGLLSRDLLGIAVDGMKADSSMTTQIFYMNEMGNLTIFPASPNSSDTVNPFSRPERLTFGARDINGDGMLEIPVVTRQAVMAEGTVADSTSYLVNWYNFNPKLENSYIKTSYALMNSAENYMFKPPGWLSTEIIAYNDSALRAVTYSTIIHSTGEDGSEVPLIGSAIFTIRVFSQTAWEEWGVTGGYEKLVEKDQQIYGLFTMTTDEKYLGAIEKIKDSFTLIS